MLGYQVTAGDSAWTSFLFDFKEDATSCGTTPVSCFSTYGINSADFRQNNTAFLDGLLCDGTDLPDDPGSFPQTLGWVRSFVSGLEGNENHVGFIYERCHPGGRWMNTNRETVESNEIQSPTGVSSRASSQLVYYYDQTDHEVFMFAQGTGDSWIQLTNTNTTEGVWVHVQIYSSFDAGEADGPPVQDGDEVICQERDFVDFLTPNDTHVYYLDIDSFTKNIGEAEGQAGEETSIDVSDTKGFIVVTPVISESDFTAKSFQHLIGTSRDWLNPAAIRFTMNAMGRDAVDFTTGQILADNTPLDGTSNGFVLLQPEEFLFDFGANNVGARDVNVVGIAFADNYGPAGLLGYQAVPADTLWTPFLFDYKEDPTSCGNRPVSCFLTVGLNDTYGQHNQELSQNDLLCGGTNTPDHPDGGINEIGWARVLVSGLAEGENHIGIFMQDGLIGIPAPSTTYSEGARYMYVSGEGITGGAPPENCAVAGDEDGDGLSDCADADGVGQAGPKRRNL